MSYNALAFLVVFGLFLGMLLALAAGRTWADAIFRKSRKRRVSG